MTHRTHALPASQLLCLQDQIWEQGCGEDNRQALLSSLATGKATPTTDSYMALAMAMVLELGSPLKASEREETKALRNS